MNLAPVFKQRFFDSNGMPLAGGQLFTYAAGTTTPQGTYADAGGTTNPNPVVLDSSGYASIWLDPSLSYKVVLTDSTGATIYSVDNVSLGGSGGVTGISTWNANSVYSQGAIVTDTSGYGLMYVSLIANNVGNPLTNVSDWRMFLGNTRTVSASSTLLVTDEFVRSDTTAGALTQTLPPCSTTPIGKRITIKDVGTGQYQTSVKGSGTDPIDGNNTWTYTLNQHDAGTFENQGTLWDVI